MRRLTLILSDLYLPAGADKAELPNAIDLPSLDWLLRFAHSVERIDDWRRWLAVQIGAGDLAELPIAKTVALAEGGDPEGAWLATPVSLEARLDHVRLRDRGLLSVTLEEGFELEQEFGRIFGPDMRLKHISSRGFLLLGGPRGEINTVDPARLLDADIGDALPKDNVAARELRKLGTEIELWLHSTAVNKSRAVAHKRQISALWLWGGGAPSRSNRTVGTWPDCGLHGYDPYMCALADLRKGPTDPLSTRLQDVREDRPAFVEIDLMSQLHRSTLDTLEECWLKPARDALSANWLQELTIVANDRVFCIGARPAWRFWRRRKHWLEALGA